MDKKKSIDLAILLTIVFTGAGFYLYKSYNKDQTLYVHMKICDWLYVLAPEKTHESPDSGIDNKIKIKDSADNKIAEIAYERKTAGKFRLVEVKTSGTEVLSLAQSTNEYSGFYFDHGNAYVPSKCTKVTFLDLRDPSKVQLKESTSPTTVSQLTQ